MFWCRQARPDGEIDVPCHQRCVELKGGSLPEQHLDTGLGLFQVAHHFCVAVRGCRRVHSDDNGAAKKAARIGKIALSGRQLIEYRLDVWV
ncbi:hypothetical protein A5784_03675 [Mycobacterium sp. 852013-50091_SCH5140682]|nr:hypothetical protein A5784_03675 [Mycobacterium sp. 852013-50091_SCH5140682]